jgi:hypothetical protein
MPTSGRYQSRFFSFLSEQSLRLRDKTSQTWRQMKITAAMGMQIVLYPIYLAFQTTRLVGRQLQQTVQRVLPLLQAVNQPLQPTDRPRQSQLLLSADTPIQNTLDAIEQIIQSLPSPITIEQPIEQLPSMLDTAISPPSLPLPPLQSIATLLNTRHLVLITAENQILDILTADQQVQLQRRMVWEMATYWQQRRSLGRSRVMINFLPLPGDRPNALLPIRVFYRLMTWMQTSPIAIATNFFQESRLAVLHTLATNPAAALPAAEPLLQSAELPWLSLPEALNGVFKPSISSVNRAQSKSFTARISTRLRDWWHADSAKLVHLPAQSDSSPPSSPPQPWLTWEDLFGHRAGHRPPTAKSIPEWELFDPTRPSAPIQGKSTPVKRHSAHLCNSPSSPLPIVLQPEESADRVTAAPSPQTEESALSTTWVEAEVKLVTYVKHPLEQVLEWLDRGMLWVEEKIASAVKWLRDQLGRG